MTRSSGFAARGDLAGSFALHPAGLLVLALCAAGVLLHLHILVRGRRTARHAALQRLGHRTFVVGLLAAYVIRLL